jgi:hypothetical protein
VILALAVSKEGKLQEGSDRQLKQANGEVVQRQTSLNSHRQPLFRPHQRSVMLLTGTKDLAELVSLKTDKFLGF